MTCIDCGIAKDLDHEGRCDDCYDIEWARREKLVFPDKGVPRVFAFTLLSIEREGDRFGLGLCMISGPEKARALLHIHKEGDWVDWHAFWWSTFE
jgi:hypothetical protein